MAATYEVVPYLVKVRVKGDTSDALRWNDFDAAGTSVLDYIAQAGLAHQGEARVASALDDAALRVVGVQREGDRVVVLTASSGQRGIKQTWERHEDGSRKTDTIHEDDWMYTEFRHVFYSPGADSKVGVLLAERAMGRGALTRLRLMLHASLRHAHPDLELDINPAMSPEAMERWAKESVVKGLVLELVNPQTGETQAAPTIGGKTFSSAIEIKAPRRQAWALSLFGGVNASPRAVLMQVVPHMPGVTADTAGAVADQMLEEGWRVSFELAHDKRRRKMRVATKAGVTLTFPAALDSTGAEIAESRAPSHDEFTRACRKALEEMGEDGFQVGDVKGCSWDSAWWDTPNRDPRWAKAVWGVPESEPAESSS
ncbi:hypothetical protein [Janibacter terrae]|uniref:hypothetical protein n=1 Tax=Janibacter terrae TaxID=103817 RepID=UPI0008317EED|nr:hypothetical protein [Janibacter terrae]